MDNASFHHADKVKTMCRDTGVKVIYLPLYSPDLNSIEEFFAELKARIKRQWAAYNGITNRDFCAFLEWCMAMVGRNRDSAEGHFRHTGYAIREH